MRRRLPASASDASREALNSSKQREAPPLPVGRKIEIGSVMQLSGKRDAALPAPVSPQQCHSDSPALVEPERKGLAGLLS
ncbi:MAG TPA: hypothetical protein VNH18_03020, partial [Bryobacteraceae bacterium]|nr:hypothetical protein [Bryobacteraceae bacterium]